jgi:hypothetical protein
MDLAFEIGISSAAQIALLVVPVLVIASLFLGNCRSSRFEPRLSSDVCRPPQHGQYENAISSRPVIIDLRDDDQK